MNAPAASSGILNALCVLHLTLQGEKAYVVALVLKLWTITLNFILILKERV